MIDLITLFIAAGVFALLCCGGRALFLLIRWRPAAATVLHSDYSVAQRRDDLWGAGTLRPYRLGDGDGVRLLSVEVKFVDVAGRTRRAKVNRYASWRWNPTAGFTIWYDPADPARATGIGPGYWTVAALTLIVGIVTFIRAGAQLGG